MPITREFLGLTRPPLQMAADFLLDRYQGGDSVSMASAIAVVPGSRAGRRLLELLVAGAAQRSLPLEPPQIETVGDLPEQLYPPQKPFATRLTQQLAWVHVLQHAEPSALAPVLAAPPARDDRLSWMELGSLFVRQHAELAADSMDFGDVATRGGGVPGFGEEQRWAALRQLQQAYLRLLDELELWDVQTARLVAIDRRECRTDRELFVIGAVDMPVTLRQMLDQVAGQVTAFVFAPPEWADRFDAHGCLIPAAWAELPIPLDARQVHVVDGPAEQADRVARCLAAYEGRFRPDEITIGLADERITPHVERQLEQGQLAARSAAGFPLAQTAPYRLLAAVADYLSSGRYREFAALVRHPDVVEWIDRQGVAAGWLEQLDAYYAAHLQARLDAGWLGAASKYHLCRQVQQRITRWLEPLGGEARPLDQWSAPLRALLLEVYGDRWWNRDEARDRRGLQAFEKINAVWDEHREGPIPRRLMPACTAAEAVRLTLAELEPVKLGTPSDPQAIELLGWLELPWDDAPALIVTSFNEGHVPSSLNSDLFLPNALRQHLGLQDNARRYARDAYALSVVLATRAQVDLIVARRNSEGDPLAPSRLLFAADAETVAQRAWAFFQPPRPRHELPPLAGRLSAGREVSAFTVPRPGPLPTPLTALSVTAFRDYLACPYRFYLTHVLDLKEIHDAADELDGGAFGTLLHAVLKEFGLGPARDSTDPEELRATLLAALDRQVATGYGGRPLPAVRVQVEQLRVRLAAFARKQAEHAAAGWRIEHTEVPGPELQAVLDVDGQPLRLHGRIDRIDVHRQTGERIIFDYKSSDSGKTPDQVHRRSGRWVDLQLPLYRHLAKTLGIAAARLGYILLPKDTSRVAFCLAEWTEAELAEADEAACAVVRGLRAECFWPRTEPPPDYAERFAPICQDGVQEKDWT